MRENRQFEDEQFEFDSPTAGDMLSGSVELEVKRTSAEEFNRAKQEWLERYGDYLSQAKNWRLACFLCLILALVSVVGVVYMGSRNQIVPYVVEINSDGVARAISRADEAQPVDSRVIKAMIGRFVVNVRSVSVDSQVQRQMILEAFTLLSSNSPATTTLKDYFSNSQNNPMKRAQTELVNVEIRSILPTSKETWAIEWTETVRDRTGKALGTSHMKAMATIAIVPPTDDATILRNPIGLYIEDFTWAKTID